MSESISWLLFSHLAAADVISITDMLSDVTRWAAQKYKEAPAIMLGIALALLLPVLAISSPIIRMLLRAADASRRPHPARQQAATPQPGTNDFAVPLTRPASAWQQTAWLEPQASRSANYPIIHNLVRIGRAADNDLCLENLTVHRYHAVLERTPEAEFFISYLGDPGYDGLLINSRPAQRERLRGGEIIQIGEVTMRFGLQRPELTRELTREPIST